MGDGQTRAKGEGWEKGAKAVAILAPGFRSNHHCSRVCGGFVHVPGSIVRPGAVPRGCRQHDELSEACLAPEDVNGSTPTVSRSGLQPRKAMSKARVRVRMFVTRRIVLFLRVVGAVRPRDRIASTRKSEGTPTMSRQIVQNKSGSWSRPSRFWQMTVHRSAGFISTT